MVQLYSTPRQNISLSEWLKTQNDLDGTVLGSEMSRRLWVRIPSNPQKKEIVKKTCQIQTFNVYLYQQRETNSKKLTLCSPMGVRVCYRYIING